MKLCLGISSGMAITNIYYEVNPTFAAQNHLYDKNYPKQLFEIQVAYRLIEDVWLFGTFEKHSALYTSKAYRYGYGDIYNDFHQYYQSFAIGSS